MSGQLSKKGRAKGKATAPVPVQEPVPPDIAHTLPDDLNDHALASSHANDPPDDAVASSTRSALGATPDAVDLDSVATAGSSARDSVIYDPINASSSAGDRVAHDPVTAASVLTPSPDAVDLAALIRGFRVDILSEISTLRAATDTGLHELHERIDHFSDGTRSTPTSPQNSGDLLPITTSTQVPRAPLPFVSNVPRAVPSPEPASVAATPRVEQVHPAASVPLAFADDHEPPTTTPREVLYVRGLVDRFCTPRRSDEGLENFIARRLDVTRTWLLRPQLPVEDNAEYRQRLDVYGRIMASLPRIDAEDRAAARAPSSSSVLLHTPPLRHATFAPSHHSASPRASALPRVSVPRSTPFTGDHRAYSIERDDYEAAERAELAHNRPVRFIDALLAEQIDVEPAEKAVADIARKAKLPLPEKYLGQPKPELFQRWFAEMCTYIVHQNMLGPQFDRVRVQLTLSCLGDVAASWFYDEVLSPDRERREWLFREVIHSLYEMFVPKSAFIAATEDFDKCRYSSDDGVRALWIRLRTIAARLPSRPDTYTMARRFLSALPKEIFDHVTITRGLTAELSPAHDLVAAAEEIASSLHISRAHDDQLQQSQLAVQGADAATARSPVKPPSTSFVDKTLPRLPDSNGASSSAVDKPKQDGRDISSYLRDPSRVLCYACGLYGHRAKDPVCPKFHLRAQVVRAAKPDEEDDDNPAVGSPSYSEYSDSDWKHAVSEE